MSNRHIASWVWILVIGALGCLGLGAKDRICKLFVKQGTPVSMSFIREDAAYLLPSNSKAAERWTSDERISDIRISPKGDALAYTVYLKTSGGADLRQIAVIDSKGLKPRVIASPTEENCYGPIWSPNGEMLLFQYWNEKHWSVAVVNRDGTGFRKLIQNKRRSGAFEMGCWSRDSKTFFVSDLENIYHVTIDGTEIDRIGLEELPLRASSSGGRMDLSPDGSQLLIETSVEEPGAKNQFDPPPVVFLYGLRSKTLERLTPKGESMDSPCWLPDGKSFVFHKVGKTGDEILRMDISSKQTSLLVSGGKRPSLAR